MRFEKVINGLTFFPYLGWMIGLYLAKAQESHDNARSSLVLAFTMVIANIFLTVVDQMLPANLIFVSFVCNSLIYILTGAYLVFSLAACVLAAKGKKIKLPVISEIAYTLNI